MLKISSGESRRPTGPSSAPRGFLRFYMLHKISKGHTHGYEIMHEIDEKTDGAWRPSPGSIYLILKDLLSEGLIEETNGERQGTNQRVYSVTKNGQTVLDNAKKSFLLVGQRMSSLRRLFVDMMDPEYASKFIIEGASKQFALAHELLESKGDNIGRKEMEYVLKEYEVILEKEIDWVKTRLGPSGQGVARSRAPIINIVKGQARE